MKYLLFAITFILVSCAEKPETALKVSIGAIGTNTNFDGGLVLLGKSNNGFRVSKVVPLGDSAEIYLPNGTWNFAVIGWDTAGIMESASYCAFQQGVSLNGADIVLNMNATTANCINPMFGGNMDTFNSNPQMFQKVQITSCTDANKWINYYGISNIPDGLNCNGGEEPLSGEFKSFKVIIPEAIAGNNQLLTGGGLNSACLTNSSHNVYTALRLPKGSAQVPIPYIIQAFSDTSCAGSGYMREFRFINGLTDFAQDNKAASKYDAQLNSGSDKGRRILLNSVPCNPDMLAAQSGDFPIITTGTPNSYLICSKTDFANIAVGGNDLNGIYHIAADIDFSPGGNTTIPTFNGQLKGNGHTLSNGNNPLIDTINAQGTTEVQIDGLNIENFTITSSIDTGVLANNVVASAGTQRVEIFKNKIRNSSIANATASTNIGGLIGEINIGAGTDYVFIRLNDVQVDITGSNDNQKIGGLVGISDGGAGQVAFEGNFVGVADIDDTSDRTGAVTITSSAQNPSGFTNSAVGGLIGFSTATEVRDYNFVISDINGVEKVGGIIGGADANTHVKNSFANLVFAANASCANSSSGVCAQVGGIIGYIPAITTAEEVKVIGTVSSLKINNSSDTIDFVGGVLGDYFSTSPANDIKISDSRAYVDIATYGFGHGGVIGNFDVQTAAPHAVIDRVYTHGALMTGTSGTDSDEKGGLVGYAVNIKSKMSVVDIEIEGKRYLGGGYGWAEGASIGIEECYLKSELYSKYATDNAFRVGGAMGHLETLTSGVSITVSKIETNIYLKAASASVPNTADIGASYGFFNDSIGNANNSMYAHSIFVGNIYWGTGDTANTLQLDDNFICGTLATGDVGACTTSSIGTLAAIYNTDSAGTCTSLGTAPFDFENIAGRQCVPLFESKWRKYGLVTGVGFEYYKAGSRLEPLPISSFADWNGIGTDEFLLSKTFELTQNVSFDGQDFLPIGVRYEDDTGTDITDVENAFEGQILSNGYKLMDIELSPTNVDSGTGIGIIHAMTKDARLGDRHEPFVIENLNIECTQIGGCGIISYAHNARLYVDARNVTISSGISALNCMGGLIGHISDDTSNGAVVEIENSRFIGAIDGYNATTSATGVGGLVGCVGDGAGQAEQLTIKQTAVNLKALKGNDNIGGMIGTVNSDIASIGINESYINFVADNNYSPQISCDACNGTDDNYAGFVGFPGSTSINLVDVFIDTSQVTFDTTNWFNIAFGFGSAISDAAQDRIAYIFPAGYTDTDESLTLPGNAGTKLFEATSQANLNTANDGFNDINLSNEFVPVNGLYKLEWEVEGHNN